MQEEMTESVFCYILCYSWESQQHHWRSPVQHYATYIIYIVQEAHIIISLKKKDNVREKKCLYNEEITDYAEILINQIIYLVELKKMLWHRKDLYRSLKKKKKSLAYFK